MANSVYKFIAIAYFVVNAENIPLNVVRKFAHLLDRSDTDYLEEIGKLISQPHNLNFSDE